MNNPNDIATERHSEVNQLGQGAGIVEGRKTKGIRTSSRPKRTKCRKRNIDGQLASGSQTVDSLHEINMDNVRTSNNETEQIDVIDVEQFKDLPLVDLTKDTKNEIFVDLTKSQEGAMSPQLSKSVICVSPLDESHPSRPLRKNEDDIKVLVSGPERTDSAPQQSEDFITCAICMDNFDQIKKGKRQLTSTMCGHVFCNTCISNALSTQAKCPTCRKKVTRKQLHPIFL